MKYVGSFPPNYNGAVYNNAAPNNYYYGGGYYNQQPYGYYGGYPVYDPLEIRRRQEEQIRIYNETRRGYIEVMKTVIKANCHFYNEEVDEEKLDEYFSDSRMYDIQKENQERMEMYNMHQNHKRAVAEMKRRNAELENRVYNTEVEDMSLLEFLEGKGRDDYINMLEEKRFHESRRAVGQLYSHNGYDELLRIHNANKYLNPYTTIDDMEVTLPYHIKREKDIRKQQFLSSILGGGPNG